MAHSTPPSAPAFRVVVAVAGLLLAAVAVADTLSDFQYAARQKGCASIPYSDLQSQCVNTQRKVDDWCKSRGKIGCDDLGSVPGLNKSIEGIEARIKSLQGNKKTKERELTSADSAKKKTIEAELEDIDAEIANLTGRIATLRAQAEQATTEISRRIEIVKGCVQYRTDVQDIFDKVSAQAAAEKDADVIPVARQLIDYWQDEHDGHETAIRDYTTAQQKCEDRLP